MRTTSSIMKHVDCSQTYKLNLKSSRDSVSKVVRRARCPFCNKVNILDVNTYHLYDFCHHFKHLSSSDFPKIHIVFEGLAFELEGTDKIWDDHRNSLRNL